LTQIKNSIVDHGNHVKSYDLPPQVKTQYNNTFLDANNKLNSIINQLNQFVSEYRSKIISKANLKNPIEIADQYISQINAVSNNLIESCNRLKNRAKDVVNYSEALYHTKEKVAMEKIREKELSRVEVIKNWPIPTAYQFLVILGLGLVTTGSAVTIFKNGQAIFLPLLGALLIFIGTSFWHKHDRAKLVAYSQQTDIDAEEILKGQGLSGYFTEQAKLEIITGNAKQYEALNLQELYKKVAFGDNFSRSRV